jgi:hypothetical protein
MPQRPPMSRWRASSISFGPVGRLVVTAIALVPVWWLFGANVVALAMSFQIGFFFAACAWTIFVVPRLLRDIWKKVPDHDATPILDLPEDRDPTPPGESILDRPAPSRW